MNTENMNNDGVITDLDNDLMTEEAVSNNTTDASGVNVSEMDLASEILPDAETPAKKKRGRKKKSGTSTTEASEATVADDKPKNRGRKKAGDTTEESQGEDISLPGSFARKGR